MVLCDLGSAFSELWRHLWVPSRTLGLDPAYPDFQSSEAPDRLDKEDADFVAVIHTNTEDLPLIPEEYTIGFPTSIGTADFYPNGGKFQPGCQGLWKIKEFIKGKKIRNTSSNIRRP